MGNSSMDVTFEVKKKEKKKKETWNVNSQKMHLISVYWNILSMPPLDIWKISLHTRLYLREKHISYVYTTHTKKNFSLLGGKSVKSNTTHGWLISTEHKILILSYFSCMYLCSVETSQPFFPVSSITFYTFAT